MIISVEELKQFITTDKADQVLEMKLQALEQLIRELSPSILKYVTECLEIDSD